MTARSAWPQKGSATRPLVTGLNGMVACAHPLAAMAGGKLPQGQVVRGRNFLPLLVGKKVEWNNDLYGEYSQHHYVQAHLRAYRTPKWKLVRDFKNEGKDELYHIATDPAENQSLIDEPAHAAIQQVLDTKLRAVMRRIGF